MKTYVIGDIHGKVEIFLRTLEHIGLKPLDQLILLGDLIDRGEDSKGVLDAVLGLMERNYQVHCLMGNHEQMLLDAFAGRGSERLWLMNGGRQTLSSFGVDSPAGIPLKYLSLMQSFSYLHEWEDWVFVHAALNMRIPDPVSDKKVLLWERDPGRFLDKAWLGERRLVHGHTPIALDVIQASVRNRHRLINIDNGVSLAREGFGKLCVLELNEFRLTWV